MPTVQARYWIITLSCAISPLQPEITHPVVFGKGQQEIGESGFRHWQFIIILCEKASLRTIQRLYPGSHAEPSRSKAAESYVWKEETAVEGTRFELGTKPIQRNSKTDWDRIWELAKSGDVISIPANIRIQNYRTIRSIASDYGTPVGYEKTVRVYIGSTGTGKSRRAWDEGGIDSYPKDPRSKFWCGYRGQANVIIDEFRGGIDVGHLLRWLDRYPVIVEIKGSSVVLAATNIWITSNLPIKEWYPGLDDMTFDALLRRVKVTNFHIL